MYPFKDSHFHFTVASLSKKKISKIEGEKCPMGSFIYLVGKLKRRENTFFTISEVVTKSIYFKWLLISLKGCENCI